ncbi:glutamate synthase [Bacillus sp. DNRA2]|uniref:GltB/FmdC/FwdC-like GXGXG domain-containing protein n=1 Tax=Bacillus sp. DNRA2 TaxID=2723053 RepID=UPI00145F2C3E|nr:glutamate synthase [Bacillus sp. DNRA2]NMD71782.1 glutamate synthase [Bacillus sp. DNRA2]
MEFVKEQLVIDCNETSPETLNAQIRDAAKRGIKEVVMKNPYARHNLGVGITDPIHLIYEGDVGYYAASLCDHISAEVHGNAGWAIGENLMNGEIIVEGNAASSTAASMRGGSVVIKGSSGARTGIGLKGGTLIVGGNVGYMTGFMMQKGRMIICGNAGKALGDSMYDGTIYVAGDIAELGNGTKMVDLPKEEYEEIKSLLESYGIDAPKAFKKIVCNGMLHNFNKKEFGVWKTIL